MPSSPPPRHNVTRIRRETRRRMITVAASEQLTPHMLRIRFEAPDLIGFESAAPDDHVKLFVPTGEGHAMRDYTPRAFDPERGLLTIDFAVHDAGPATHWALQARPGHTIEIGGPRGSTMVADDFDWYLLVGDETAIPAIGRRLEEIRGGVSVFAAIVVDTEADRHEFATAASLEVKWLCRAAGEEADSALLQRALAAAALPAGDGYVWIAAEAQVARTLRAFVLETLGHRKEWTKASGYWQAGAVGQHVTIGD